MGCPEKSSIEQLVAGALSEDDSKSLLAHLAKCPGCRQEAAFLTAIRLSLPLVPPSPKCLSDESLSLLRDGLLPEEEHEEYLSHMSDCRRCLGAWLSLDRSLQEAAREPVSPPAHLVKKAVALGTKEKETEKISFLQRLLGPSPVWRLSLAGAAAAVVLVLTVVLSVEPPEYERPAPLSVEPPALVADDTLPVEPQVPSTEPVTAPVKPAPSVEKPQPAEGARAEDWLAALSTDKRLGLVKGLKPKASLPRVEVGKAYKAPVKQASLSDGYQLGRHLGYLLAFAEHLDNPPGVRAQLGEAALSLAPMLRPLVGEKSGKQLVGFANDLGKGLSSEMTSDSARRKLEVFTQALSEAVPQEEPAGLGIQLGLLASQLEVASTAQKLGYGPPRRAWPSRKSVSRVRTLVRKVKDLPEKDRQDVLSSLERIEKMAEAPPRPAKASKILEELHSIDRNVRATR